MSRSNAAAINRRVNVPTSQPGSNLKPTVTNSVNQTQQPSVLTLPQVITVFDNRIMLLEKFMTEAKHSVIQNNNQPTSSENVVQPASNENVVQPASNKNVVQTTSSEKNVQEKTNFNAMEHVSINDFNTIITEFNNRFELFAHEISDLKDIVLKLQSYTMEVNKTLLEEKNRTTTNSVTNSDLVNTNEESKQSIETNEHVQSIDNTSIDLKNLIKQEFSQTN